MMTGEGGAADGFTLVELMVALLIAAILLAIAIPGYRSYALRAHRTDAKTALLDLASMEERYFNTQQAYTNVANNLGYGAQNWPITIGSGYYQINTPLFTNPTAPTAANNLGTPATFTITAVPIGTQANDTACASFTVTSAGARTALNSGGGDNSATCWN